MAGIRQFTILALVSVFIAVPAQMSKDASGLVVDIVTDGTYKLVVNGDVWLPSAPTYFYADRAKYSSADGSLKLVQSSATSGEDKLGQWQDTIFRYHAGDNVVTASIRTYQGLSIVLFTQKYLNAVSGSSSGDYDSLSSAFPSFQVNSSSDDIGYLSYGGEMLACDHITFGRWTNTTAKVVSGIISGPLVLFDHSRNALVVSTFSQFMASQSYQDGNTVSWGIMGGVTDIPAMYEYTTIVFYGNQGINQAMADWGTLMRYYYNRDQSYTESALNMNYIGYWTDNGAFYFHLTENNKTYEETILDVKAYATEMNIPYRYVMYDNWWYYHGEEGGVKTWEGMPNIFPHGMEYVYNLTGWPVHAQNKWWSASTTYAKQNGGKYNFIVETHAAIPQDPTFWVDLLRESRKWGLVTYEQDWLDYEFKHLNATLTTVNVARDWLMQMGEGAAKNDLTIQYCMSNAKHGLQSLEISVVTHARVSHDYNMGTYNWNIGTSSIFAEALGLGPYKDNFWTTANQPHKYPVEGIYPELEAAIATLSTGPVGPSDMIGRTNISLLMRSCNADGLILKPSRPARSIDTNIMQKAFNDGSGPDGEVWSTYSKVSGYFFGIILAPQQINSVRVKPSEAGFGFDFPRSVIFRRTWPLPASPTFSNFTESSPVTISNCDLTDACLWHTIPAVPFGGSPVYLFGELEKWVPMSPKRVVNINIAEDIYITAVGATQEAVDFSYSVGTGNINTISCNLGDSGTAVIALMAKVCTPQ